MQLAGHREILVLYTQALFRSKIGPKTIFENCYSTIARGLTRFNEPNRGELAW